MLQNSINTGLTIELDVLQASTHNAGTRLSPVWRTRIPASLCKLIAVEQTGLNTCICPLDPTESRLSRGDLTRWTKIEGLAMVNLRNTEPCFIYAILLCAVMSVSRCWSCIRPRIRGIEAILPGKRFMAMLAEMAIFGCCTFLPFY